MKKPKAPEQNKFSIYLESIEKRKNNATGFQNPADEYISLPLDLNRKLINNQPATYILIVGENIDPHIEPKLCAGDLIIVDRSLNPTPNCPVILINDNQFIIKTFIKEKFYKDNLEFWGVITYIIKKAIK